MGGRACVNVCLWHLADINAPCLACPLLRVKRTCLTRSLMSVNTQSGHNNRAPHTQSGADAQSRKANGNG